MAQGDQGGDADNIPNMVVAQDDDGNVLIAVQRKDDTGEATISHIL